MGRGTHKYHIFEILGAKYSYKLQTFSITLALFLCDAWFNEDL